MGGKQSCLKAGWKKIVKILTFLKVKGRVVRSFGIPGSLRHKEKVHSLTLFFQQLSTVYTQEGLGAGQETVPDIDALLLREDRSRSVAPGGGDRGWKRLRCRITATTFLSATATAELLSEWCKQV